MLCFFPVLLYPSIHPSIYPLIHSFINSFIHSFLPSFLPSLLLSFFLSFFLSFILLFIYLFINIYNYFFTKINEGQKKSSNNAWFNFTCYHPPPGNPGDKSSPLVQGVGNCLKPSCRRGWGGENRK